MELLIIGILCALASTKVTLQTCFAKNTKLSTKGSILYNGIAFSVIALLFSPSVFTNGIHRETIYFGMAMGMLSVLYQLFYIASLSTGKMALTAVINNFSMLIPIGVSVIWFDEPFGLMRIIGTMLAVLSLTLNVSGEKSSDKKVSMLWIVCLTITFLSNGSLTGVQKIYTKLCEVEIFGFVAVTYFTAAVLSFLVLPFLGREKIKFTKRSGVFATLTGVVLGTFLALNTYATSIIPGTFLFPAYNCGVSLILSLTGVLLFKEKLTVKQIVGICTGTLAIILMSL